MMRSNMIRPLNRKVEKGDCFPQISIIASELELVPTFTVSIIR